MPPAEIDCVPGKLGKAEATRRKILTTALEIFGKSGFKDATTREIAERSGVSLPTLQYHFGNKEGLYLACARAIIERYAAEFGPLGSEILKAHEDGLEPRAARVLLKRLMRKLVDFLLGSEAKGTLFVLREVSDPGPAFESLYANVWSWGIELCAGLIARISGGRADAPEVRIQALLLISNLHAFQAGLQVALRTLVWTDLRSAHLELVKAAIDRQIDLIGNPA